MMWRFFSWCVAVVGVAVLCPAQQLDETLGETLEPSFPKEELHIRSGVMLLASLYDVLAKVQDKASAQAAVPKIVRISRDLHAWGQAVASLPPLNEKEIRVYENRYLPIIRRVNDHLRAQGERLAAWEYYGSQDLEYALISLYTMAQQ